MPQTPGAPCSGPCGDTGAGAAPWPQLSAATVPLFFDHTLNSPTRHLEGPERDTGPCVTELVTRWGHRQRQVVLELAMEEGGGWGPGEAALSSEDSGLAGPVLFLPRWLDRHTPHPWFLRVLETFVIFWTEPTVSLVGRGKSPFSLSSCPPLPVLWDPCPPACAPELSEAAGVSLGCVSLSQEGVAFAAPMQPRPPGSDSWLFAAAQTPPAPRPGQAPDWASHVLSLQVRVRVFEDFLMAPEVLLTRFLSQPLRWEASPLCFFGYDRHLLCSMKVPAGAAPAGPLLPHPHPTAAGRAALPGLCRQPACPLQPHPNLPLLHAVTTSQASASFAPKPGTVGSPVTITAASVTRKATLPRLGV